MVTRKGMGRTSRNPFGYPESVSCSPCALRNIWKVEHHDSQHEGTSTPVQSYCTQLLCAWSPWAIIVWKAPGYFSTYIHKAKESKKKKNSRAPQETHCEQNASHFCKLFIKSVTILKEKNIFSFTETENPDNSKDNASGNNCQWINVYAMDEVFPSLSVTADSHLSSFTTLNSYWVQINEP